MPFFGIGEVKLKEDMLSIFGESSMYFGKLLCEARRRGKEVLFS